MTGVGVGIGVGKFSSTPTPARSRSRFQHFFIISFLSKMETKMETEHYVQTADSHDGVRYSCTVPCTVLLSLGLRLFPGELAFNHTSRLDNHNRQCHWSDFSKSESESESESLKFGQLRSPG